VQTHRHTSASALAEQLCGAAWGHLACADTASSLPWHQGIPPGRAGGQPKQKAAGLKLMAPQEEGWRKKNEYAPGK